MPISKKLKQNLALSIFSNYISCEVLTLSNMQGEIAKLIQKFYSFVYLQGLTAHFSFNSVFRREDER